MSERIDGLPPQYVAIIQDGPHGWAMIMTEIGEKWIYINSNAIMIPSYTGLHEMPFIAPFTVVPPQRVNIIDQRGDWILAYTSNGKGWLDLSFPFVVLDPPIYDLDIFLGRFGNRISVYFENLATGFIYTYNGGRRYFSASVPKASFAMYILQQAERGETDLNEILTFTESDRIGGSGVIRHRYNTGARFTRRELLRLNVSESDNIATNILRRVHGTGGYRQFVANIGGDPSLVGNRIMNSTLTAYEAGLFAREIFRFAQSGSTYGQMLRDDMLNNQFPFIVADYPVASKTGWTRPTAWHDMAIIYAPSPFILVILSERNGWTERDYRDFAEISRLFQDFNNRWFS